MTVPVVRGPLCRWVWRHNARIAVRAALRRDVPALLLLLRAATVAEHRLVPDIAAHRLDARIVRRNLRRSIAHPQRRMFVATHRGEVLGMVGAELVTARRPHAAVHRYAYLHSLFVVPAAQRLGLGRQLSRLALDWGRGRGAMQARVEMAAPNAAARRLYASLGFRLREMMLAMPLQSVR